jgi:ATP-dependent RNA helicase RhlE
VHRVGRTGRGTQKGQAYSFSSSEEKELLKEIEENLGNPISRLIVSKDEYQLTVDNSKANEHDWQSLIDEAEEFQAKKKKAKAKKKAKKK